MPQNTTHPKIILLKGNGPITINNEMMELFTITLSHGLVGLPLKSLHADTVYIVNDLRVNFQENIYYVNQLMHTVFRMRCFTCKRSVVPRIRM